jgi:hypothetical protein
MLTKPNEPVIAGLSGAVGEYVSEGAFLPPR